jgi:hypothetical protein
VILTRDAATAPQGVSAADGIVGAGGFRPEGRCLARAPHPQVPALGFRKKTNTHLRKSQTPTAFPECWLILFRLGLIFCGNLLFYVGFGPLVADF